MVGSRKDLVVAQGPRWRADPRNLKQGRGTARNREAQIVAALMARQRSVVRSDDGEGKERWKRHRWEIRVVVDVERKRNVDGCGMV